MSGNTGNYGVESGNDMDWKSVQAAWPVNQEMIWLNNCGITPPGLHITEAVKRFLDGYARKCIFTETAGYAETRSRIKAILGGLLNCAPDELALIHNTSEGMNVVSRGLSLSPGDEIILLENEYPSNVYPWRHWAKKGVTLCTAPACDSPEKFLETLETLITDKTRVMALSAVHWCTGMPLPLEKIGKICRERNIFLAVDGAQGVGMQPIDVKRYGIDFMAFSAWKWLMGPLGMGVLYVASDKLDLLEPVFVGTDSVVNSEEYLPYKEALNPGADRFTFSTPGFTDWVYFLAALEFLEKTGFDVVRERIFALGRYLSEQARQAGFEVFSDRFPAHSTGIVVCEKPGVATDTVLARLRQDGIIAAARLGRIRLAPHIYISEEQLEQVGRSLAQAG